MLIALAAIVWRAVPGRLPEMKAPPRAQTDCVKASLKVCGVWILVAGSFSEGVPLLSASLLYMVIGL